MSFFHYLLKWRVFLENLVHMCTTGKSFIYYNFSFCVIYLVLPVRRIVTSFLFHSTFSVSFIRRHETFVFTKWKLTANKEENAQEFLQLSYISSTWFHFNFFGRRILFLRGPLEWNTNHCTLSTYILCQDEMSVITLS